jgi:hypothetical protein
MPPSKQLLERLFCLIKLEHLINNGMYLLLIKLQHLLKSFSGTVQDALQRNVPLQRQHIGIRSVSLGIFLPRQVSNTIYKSTKSYATRKIFEGFARHRSRILYRPLHRPSYPAL